MTIPPQEREAIVKKDDVQLSQPVEPANDNAPVLRAADVDAALTRIAQAIGWHIARKHIRARTAANDHEALPKKPTAPDP